MCDSSGLRYCLVAGSPECAEHIGPQDRERRVHEQPERDSRSEVAQVEPSPRESERQQEQALQRTQCVRR